jgi:phage FluMu gp28-like protein
VAVGFDLILTLASDPVESFRLMTGDDPLPWQEDYLPEERDAVILKGRQIGASTSGASKGVRYAATHGGCLVAIVSPSQKQSTEVKERARGQIERLGLQLDRDSETILQLHNRSRIMSLPGSAKSVRGWSADLLILDEAAFLEPETFLAARATVAATGGQVIVQSTPAGPYGHFFDLFNEAVPVEDAYVEDPDTGLRYPDPTVKLVSFRVSSENQPTISDAFLARERATMSEEEFAQEYLGKFAPPGAGLVDPAKLKAATATPTITADDFWSKVRS